MGKNKKVYLKDYKVSNYFVESVFLNFELEPNNTIVTNESIFYKNDLSDDENCLVLNGENLELLDIYLDGKKLGSKDYDIDEYFLKLKDVPDKFSLKLITKINPEDNKSLEGLYVSNSIFCTQCESEGFRKITYYLDRPDVLSIFKVRIVADKKSYPVLLSNGNLIESGDFGQGRHFALWEDPFKKPSYLFALVAGDLGHISEKFKTMSGREIDLKIYSEHHNISKCNFAMESLKKAMKWDEDRFGLEYDLDTFMIVGIDDFNNGAMENKGLNIFNSNFLFANPKTSTDLDFKYVERVIAHEYFHNWTGDRVTCRDWFQLSLKEGLTVYRDAEFSYDMHFRPIERIDDVKYLRENQFREDSGPMAHPVRPSYYEEIDNFYTLTVYEKGAEVIRMYNTILGEEGFQKGMKLYFSRHDGQAVTTEDFLQAMSDANNYDLKNFQYWYDQAGTPVVDIESFYDEEDKTLKIDFRQSCRQTKETKNKKPFVIPIKLGILLESGEEQKLENDLFILDKESSNIVYNDIKSKPTLSLFRGFSAPVKYNYNYTTFDYYNIVKNDSDYFNRYEAFHKFSIDVILGLINNGENKIDDSYLSIIEFILEDDKLDNHFRGELLNLVSIQEVSDIIGKDIDYKKIYDSISFLEKFIADLYIDKFMKIYNGLNVNNLYEFSGEEIGNRKLKNVCLKYITISDSLEYAYNQYKSSNNMTDMLGALDCLKDYDSKYREECLDDFYNRFKDDNITINKWFKIQAISLLPNTLDSLNKLINHKLFNIKNPNRAYSIFRAFPSLNPVLFNNPDGSGYNFIAENVLKIDKFNPLAAGRIAKSLVDWKKLEKNSSSKLKEILENMNKNNDLSTGLKEILENALSN